MSYNVRLFNAYGWINDPDISNKIEALIQEENPDVICFQEYSKTHALDWTLMNTNTFNPAVAWGNLP